VPGQWAVQTALGGFQSIYDLVSPGGRLHESRQAIIDAVDTSAYLTLVKPQGSMYAFVGVDRNVLPGFDDNEFALTLLEQKHILVAPGVSFNVNYNNHFRMTLLPDAATLKGVFERIDELLATYAA
jgi:alanine-synthesizing transaminase